MIAVPIAPVPNATLQQVRKFFKQYFLANRTGLSESEAEEEATQLSVKLRVTGDSLAAQCDKTLCLDIALEYGFWLALENQTIMITTHPPQLNQFWPELPGSGGRIAPDDSSLQLSTLYDPTTTISHEYMTQAHSWRYRNITILYLGKDCFGVDINNVAQWWGIYQQNYESL